MTFKPKELTYQELLDLRERRREAKKIAMRKYRAKYKDKVNEWQRELYHRRKAKAETERIAAATVQEEPKDNVEIEKC